ncbi:MAG TPA: glycosyltransferase family 39 protein [Thermoanaerobaculia bacterium]|nr:glycosyltransferase family 39 protein [Thermoanaerobaculia bacterium]
MSTLAIPTSPTQTTVQARLVSGSTIVASIAGLRFLFHMATANVYGFFIDELYFLACGQHLDWGYVDMPPLTAFQAWLTRHLFGDSRWSIRLFPSLAAAGLVLLAGAIVRELGGGRFAQILAALVVFLAPGSLVFCSYLSMNSLEPVIWGGLALLVIRILKGGHPRLWLWFGALSGIGLLNKHTMLVYGFALVMGLVLTEDRKVMFNRWFVIAGIIAFVIFLPNLVWEIRHHFPHLELLANIKHNGRDVQMNPIVFLLWDVLLLNPATAPVWMAGLVALVSGSLKRFRALGFAWIVAYLVLLATGGRFYYLFSAFTPLVAAGAIAFEGLTERVGRPWLRPAYAALIVIIGALIAPSAVPVLPPETYLRFAALTHLGQPRFEHRATTSMPQLFADRLGWPEMVATVAHAYYSLPPDVRAKTAIFGNDFGQSGAIDYYGPRYGLPKSIGAHLTNWYWGPRNYTGESVLVLGDNRERLESLFEIVKPMGQIGSPYAMDQEHFTLFLAQKPRGWTMQSAWGRLKKFE